MDSKKSRLVLAALGISAALAIVAAPLAVGAQTPPRANPPPNTARAPAQNQPPVAADPRDRGDGRDFYRRDDRLERRLDFLHGELRITTAQQRLWDDFTAAVRAEDERARPRDFDRRDDVRDRNNNGRDARPSVVERLERRQQEAADRGARVDHLLIALRPLYAALSEDQRRAADELMFRQDQSRQARWGFAMRGRFQRPFDRPYGPFDPPYDRFGRYR
jgi:hypothetical protein